MSKIEFIIELPSTKEQLMPVITDYESYSTYLPDQLKNVRILEKNGHEIVTQEEIFFSNILKKPFLQKSSHKLIDSKTHESRIISGPANGSTLIIFFDDIDNGTKITVNIDLKLSLKAKFLLPLIKKWYKRIFTNLLYHINNVAMTNIKK